MEAFPVSAQCFIIVMFRKLKMESPYISAIVCDSLNYYLAGTVVMIARQTNNYSLGSHIISWLLRPEISGSIAQNALLARCYLQRKCILPLWR